MFCTHEALCIMSSNPHRYTHHYFSNTLWNQVGNNGNNQKLKIKKLNKNALLSQRSSCFSIKWPTPTLNLPCLFLICYLISIAQLLSGYDVILDTPHDYRSLLKEKSITEKMSEVTHNNEKLILSHEF